MPKDVEDFIEQETLDRLSDKFLESVPDMQARGRQNSRFLVALIILAFFLGCLLASGVWSVLP